MGWKRKGLTLLLAAALCCAGLGGAALAYTEDYYKPEVLPAPMADGEFTLAVYGDTQCVVEHGFPYFEESARWLAEQADELHLKYMLHMGDMVNDIVDPNHPEDPDIQWKRSKAAMRHLDDAGIEYALVVGNHDYVGYANSGRDFSKFDEYFPLSCVSGMPGYGGSMDGTTLENTYSFFSGLGTDYLLLTMGYKPLNATLEWAGRIIEQYPDRKVILSTHDYLNDEGTARSPVGDRIWKNLASRYENVQFVLCGHNGPDIGYAYQTSYGEHGNEVHELMVNAQYFEGGGKAVMMLMRFRQSGKIECNLYCPSTDLYLNAPLTISLDKRLPAPDGAREGLKAEHALPYAVDYGALMSEGALTRDLYAYRDLQLAADGVQTSGETGVATLRVAASPGAVLRSLQFSADYLCAENGLQLYLDTGAGERIYANFRAGERRQEFDLSDAARNAAAVSLTFVLSPGATLKSVSLTGEKVRVVDRGDGGALHLVKTFDALADYDTESWSEEALEVKDLLVFGGLLGTGAQGRYAGAEGYAVYRFAAEGKQFERFSVSLEGRLNGKNLGYKLRLWGSIDNGKTWTLFADEQGDETNFARTYDLAGTFAGERDVMLKLGMYGDFWHSVALSKLEINASYRFDLIYDTGAGTAADNPSSYAPGDRFALRNPTPPAHQRFEGWYENAEFSGAKVTEIAESDGGAKTLYAKYAPILHNVVYHLGGGKNAADNPETFAEGEGLTPASPTRTGYGFAGWYERADFAGDPVTNIAIGTETDIELYAKWAKNYRITYVLNGGTLEKKRDSINETEEVTLGTPTREGYVFAGWYESADFAGERVERLEKGTARAVTLYAKWEAAGGGAGGCKSALGGGTLPLGLGLLAAAGLWAMRRRKNRCVRPTKRTEI